MSGLAWRFRCLRATVGIFGFDVPSRIGIRGTVDGYLNPVDRHPDLPSGRFFEDWGKFMDGKFGCQSPCTFLCLIIVVSTY
jgi:hypothetical protein